MISPLSLYNTRYNIPRSCLLLSIIVMKEFCLNNSFVANSKSQVRELIDDSRENIAGIFNACKSERENNWRVIQRARRRCGTARKHRTKICKNISMHRTPTFTFTVEQSFFFITFYNIRNRRKIVSRHVAFIRIAHVHVYNVVTTHCKYFFFFFK